MTEVERKEIKREVVQVKYASQLRRKGRLSWWKWRNEEEKNSVEKWNFGKWKLFENVENLKTADSRNQIQAVFSRKLDIS